GVRTNAKLHGCMPPNFSRNCVGYCLMYREYIANSDRSKFIWDTNKIFIVYNHKGQEERRCVMKKWKVGLVGTGWWSEKHLKAWRRIPNVEIAALCNRSTGKLEAKTEEYGIPKDRLYTSVEDMLANSDMDIV